MKKVSKIGAILSAKCPQCRQGDIFQYSLPKKPSHYQAIHKNCPECGLRYEIEPGFFVGAMYISYGFSVAIFIVFGFAAYFIWNDPPVWVYVSSVSAGVLLFFPLSFRYSRVLMLHLFAGIPYLYKKVSGKEE